jgi:hypothetical protein
MFDLSGPGGRWFRAIGKTNLMIPMRGRHRSRPSVSTASSGELDIGCLLAPAPWIVLDGEADRIAFVEYRQAAALQGGGVNENVLAAILGGYESITLRFVEELDGAVDAHWAFLSHIRDDHKANQLSLAVPIALSDYRESHDA